MRKFVFRGGEMKRLRVRRFSASDSAVWDDFVRNKAHAHFMFERAYMDYHKDRFPDMSFLCECDEKVCGVFPGTLSKEKIWASHAGLTFGGLLSDGTLGTVATCSAFDLLNEALRNTGARIVRYKPVPWIYSSFPAEEALYALFRLNAELVSRQISSAFIPGSFRAEERRSRGASKALKSGAGVSESDDVSAFWDMLAECLAERHSVMPVHSKEEMRLLKDRFPGRIRLFVASLENEILAGTLLFVTEHVIHTQYLATTARGRELGALDLLILHLLREEWTQNRYFDFGISCEQGGIVLNEGLIMQKEGFGGHGVVYDCYEYAL